jgi:hypothetical protein
MQETGRMYCVERIFRQRHDIAAHFRSDALAEQWRQG